ncbi:DUF456 family protein [Sinimarinibacterium sp. NLF-5-8]|nr:DUF456 family protein [Sinimarinibacterium sp. NLF-5-8]
MSAVLWLGGIVLVLVGLAGTVLPALPGVPLVLIGLWLVAWIDGYVHVGAWTLGVLTLMTLLAMTVDWVASALGAQRVGASPQALWGAVVGSIVGLFFGLPGILLGPFIGAVAGELSARRGVHQATRVGVATWVGLLLGSLTKLVLALMMIGIFAFAYLL